MLLRRDKIQGSGKYHYRKIGKEYPLHLTRCHETETHQISSHCCMVDLADVVVILSTSVVLMLGVVPIHVKTSCLCQ